MPSTSAPFGLRPEQNQSGNGGRGIRAVPGGIATGYNTAIYQHQPVRFATTGYITAAGATETLVGTFLGCEYTDSTGRHVQSNQWVANTAATNIVAYITDDPDMIYEIQCDGSLTIAAIGDMADTSNNTANGSGMSQATISSSLVGAGNSAQLQIVDKVYEASNDWGDTYVIVRVKINEHQFAASRNAI